jgi:hypothetical protein
MRRAGALDRAMEAAEAAVDRQEGDTPPSALRARAEIAKARGDRARALADFEALAAAVDDPAVRLELAKIHEHWTGSPARALEWAARGTGERPENAEKRVRRLARKAERVAREAQQALAELSLPGVAGPVSPGAPRTTPRGS